MCDMSELASSPVPVAQVDDTSAQSLHLPLQSTTNRLKHLVGGLLASYPGSLVFWSAPHVTRCGAALPTPRPGELSSETAREHPESCSRPSPWPMAVQRARACFYLDLPTGALSACWSVPTLLPARGSQVLIQCGSLILSWRFV